MESVSRHGFETVIEVETAEPYVGVRAQDRLGGALGRIVTADISRHQGSDS